MPESKKEQDACKSYEKEKAVTPWSATESQPVRKDKTTR